MKRLIEILRLHYEAKLSNRQIERALKSCKKTIGKCIDLFEASDLSWPLPPEWLDEDKLARHLDPSHEPDTSKSQTVIDFAEISKELRTHKSLTLQLIYDERIEQKLMPYSYSNFTLLYRKWLNKQPNYMRQTHKAGEKVFVDYSGDKIAIIDTDTGKLREAEIFVGVLGASTYIYCEATWTQQLHDWTMSHVRMFEDFGGSVPLVVPDNLLSGVSKAHRYDPDINPAYCHMLAHYGSAAMPARVRTPKDKAHGENGVSMAQRGVLASLRGELIYGLAMLNGRIRERMLVVNGKPLQGLAQSRLELFAELDKPYLRPLPKQRFVYREYKKVRVSADYHIELDHHHYSVPYTLIGQEVDLWYTSGTVECFHKNKCIASHIRSNNSRGSTTNPEHMSPGHRAYSELTVDKMRSWAQTIGVHTSAIVELIIQAAPHHELGCRRSHGFLNLSKKYSELQLDAACSSAINLGIKDYRYIEILLKNQATASDDVLPSAIPAHDNIRGSEQYH